MKRKMGTALCLVSVAAWLVACSGFQQAKQRVADSNELKQIGLAWHSYNDTFKKGPSKAEDLFPYMEGPSSPPSQALKSGKFVLYYDVSVADMRQAKDSPGLSRTILGYAATTPSSGGLILWADGMVEQMTAADFNSAKKASQYKKTAETKPNGFKK